MDGHKLISMNKIKKTIYLLNVDNYAPEITALTYPHIEFYANKIGADIELIDDRKFPEFPPVYEKLQIHDRAKKNGSDWNIYIDSDALIHPETIDFTAHVKKDTVMHNGSDNANIRWKYDEYFLRDGRNIGSCNWMTIASDWCLDLWRPIDDLTLEQILNNIQPTVGEINTVIKRSHLIDDYSLSRNIAKYGLKFKTIISLLQELGLGGANFFWHIYTASTATKVEQMKKVIENWQLEKFHIGNKV